MPHPQFYMGLLRTPIPSDTQFKNLAWWCLVRLDNQSHIDSLTKSNRTMVCVVHDLFI